MMGVIVYFSTYGSTQEYAESLAEKMGWKALNVKRVELPDIKSAETVVLASNIRIGKMGIRKWAKRHKALLKKKKLHVLAVGGDSADNQQYYRETTMKNLGFLDLKKDQISGLGGRKIRAELDRKRYFFVQFTR
ncbi:MAG: flavodoxin domain-containing protein [Candidatus Marinimicrobia bacterium]|nr:flavodoxin domain-containing protein [Candidatus Neomarinimicrobiota bacterium]